MMSREGPPLTAEEVRAEELGNERRRYVAILARFMKTAGIRSNVANPEVIARAVESVSDETLDRLRATGWDDQTIVQNVIHAQRAEGEFRRTHPQPPPTQFVHIGPRVPGRVYSSGDARSERREGVVYVFGPWSDS